MSGVRLQRKVGLAGAVYYFLRHRHLERHGVSLDELLRHETEEAARATRA